MTKYVWIETVKNFVSVGLNPDNLDDYSCSCNDKRHQFYNRYPNFKCLNYYIALEKFARLMQEGFKAQGIYSRAVGQIPPPKGVQQLDSCKGGQCSAPRFQIKGRALPLFNVGDEVIIKSTNQRDCIVPSTKKGYLVQHREGEDGLYTSTFKFYQAYELKEVIKLEEKINLVHEMTGSEGMPGFEKRKKFLEEIKILCEKYNVKASLVTKVEL